MMKVVAMAATFTLLAAAPALGATVQDFTARTFDDGKGHTLPYRLFVPRGYDPAKKYGLVLFFHGAGERGTDNARQIGQPAPLVFADAANQAKWPVFVVAPQCPTDQQWVAMPWGAPSGKGMQPAAPTWPMAAAMALLDKLLAEYPGVDPARLYVTGLSMGGFGTWDAIVRNPKKFRAAVPICGGYDEAAVAPIVNVPIWTFHAADDSVVLVQRTRDVVNALKALGGMPKYTEYPASARYGHASWNPAYRDAELLPWMFGDSTAPSMDAGRSDASDARGDAPAADARDAAVADVAVADTPVPTADAAGPDLRAPTADAAPLDLAARRDAPADRPQEPDPVAKPARRGGGCGVAGSPTGLAVPLVAVVALLARRRRSTPR